MADLNISKITKRYGALQVLHDIDLDVTSGEFVVLVGPSGCGKSTLLRMIAGLEEISSGEISIDGSVVNEVKPKDRNIAMVFQSYALYPQMTVEKNMGFSLEMQKLGKQEIAAKVKEASDILGLGELLDRKPAQLSGGQRQRVSMGRAIVRDPKVFLFDEPLSNLDAKLRVQMRAEIKSLHARLGSTIVYVTHDQIEAMTMADKIVVMRDGRIEQVGAPLDLYDSPQNIFVAGFLGSPSMNFLEAEATASGFDLVDGQSIAMAHGLETGRKVTLGMRPEKLCVARDGLLEARVTLTEPTGAETIVTVEIGATAATLLVRDRLGALTGKTVRLGFEPGDIYLFDSQSGVRLSQPVV